MSPPMAEQRLGGSCRMPMAVSKHMVAPARAVAEKLVTNASRVASDPTNRKSLDIWSSTLVAVTRHPVIAAPTSSPGCSGHATEFMTQRFAIRVAAND
mmetsp:Transcript_70276/g.195598  ORF Transcript_70276/g.195598 Transcript_70276/m.195598 type:complete len:98 (+) Transcript_70276:396-689(+)